MEALSRTPCLYPAIMVRKANRNEVTRKARAKKMWQRIVKLIENVNRDSYYAVYCNLLLYSGSQRHQRVVLLFYSLNIKELLVFGDTSVAQAERTKVSLN